MSSARGYGALGLPIADIAIHVRRLARCRADIELRYVVLETAAGNEILDIPEYLALGVLVLGPRMLRVETSS